MKTKRYVSLFIALALCGAIASALPVTVAFVDGSAQLQSGSTWKNLDFGDKFDSAQTVRLAPKAILELTVQGGSVVVISNAGNYVVDGLLKPRQEASAVATVASKLEKLARGSGQAESTVAGVRGSAVDASSLMWAGAGVEAEAAFDDGRKASESGTYSLAWDRFMEAVALYEEAADPSGAARAAWHASLAGLASGSGAKALSALRASTPDDAGALRGSYALALATLNARYGAAAEAKELLSRALKLGWFDDPAMEADAKALLAGL
jgi:tetratricopeptide (TPR) repeat protein